MSYAWVQISRPEEGTVPDPRTFTRERPPARRTTDTAMAGLSIGMTLVVAAIVVRAADRRDWPAVWTFGIAGLFLAVPTVVLCWLVVAWHLERRRGSERTSAEDLADAIISASGHHIVITPASAVGLDPTVPGRCCAAGVRAWPHQCPWHPEHVPNGQSR